MWSEPVTEPMQWFLNKKLLIDEGETFLYRSNPISKVWKLSSENEPLKILNFNHLFLEWELAHPYHEMVLNISIHLDTDDDGIPDFILQGDYPPQKEKLSLLQEIDMENGQYAVKSKMYLVKRELGFKSDDKWYYTQHEDQVVFQRRLDMALEDLDLIKFYMLPKTDLRMVVLSLDTTGDKRRDRFVTYQEMVHRREMSGGYEVEVLDLSETFKRLKIQARTSTLMETIIYIGANIPAFKKEKKIKKLATYSYQGPQNKAASNLELTVNSNDLNRTIDIDLEKAFNEQNIMNGSILSVTVEAKLESPQIVTWDNAFLADHRTIDTPVVFQEPEKKIKEFIPTFPAVEQNHVLQKFTPVFGKKFILKKINPRFISTPYGDQDFDFSVEGAYYQIEKDETHMKFAGFHMSDITPEIRLTIKKGDEKPRYIAKVENLKWCQANIIHTDKGVIRVSEWDNLLPNHCAPLELSDDGDTRFTFSILRNDIEYANKIMIPWEITIEKVDGAPFKTAPEDQDMIIQWKNNNKQFMGTPYLYYGGVSPQEEPFDIHLRYRDMFLEDRQIDISLPTKRNPFPLDLPPQSMINDITIEPEKQIELGNRTLNFLVIDTVSNDFAGEMDCDQYEWWELNQTIPLTESPSGNAVYNEEQKKLYFWASSSNVFELMVPVEQEYVQPLTLTIEKNLPPSFELAIHYPGGEIPFPEDSTIFNFQDFQEIGSDFSLRVRYSGEESLAVFPVPQLKVSWLRRTARNELNQLAIEIDEKPLKLNTLLFPDDAVEWQVLGLTPIAMSDHVLTLKNTPFFQIESTCFEAQAQYTIPTTSEVGKKAPSIVRRLKIMGMTLLVLLGVLSVLYFVRRKIMAVMKFLCQPVLSGLNKAYWFIPEEGLLVLWFLATGGLYGIGMQTPMRGHQSNYFFTMGAMAFVITFGHFMRMIKGWFFRTLPAAAVYVYRDSGTPFIAGFIVILLFILALVSVKLEPVAEQFAVTGFFFLAVGVIWGLIELEKNDREQREEKQGEI